MILRLLFERVEGFFNAFFECGARDTENASLVLFKLHTIINKTRRLQHQAI